MNSADRIRVQDCGCHYDVASGLTTHYCDSHLDRGQLRDVFCKACSRVVRMNGTESWRACRRCHQRGQLVTVARAREDGLLPAEDART